MLFIKQKYKMIRNKKRKLQKYETGEVSIFI